MRLHTWDFGGGRLALYSEDGEAWKAARAAGLAEDGSKLCVRCNAIWFVPSSNRQKYCLSCRLAAYRENRRAHRREYMRAYYLKKKLGSRTPFQTTLF